MGASIDNPPPGSNSSAAMPLAGPRARAIAERLALLGVREQDLDETFVHSGGKGGQNVNKVATCVVLVHRPTRTMVKCQRERAQGANRLIARQMLADKIEEQQLGRASRRQQEMERVRRQKRRRSRRAKQKMLAGKHAQSSKKALRGPVRGDE
jgi:protein subunit release factor B